MWAPPTDTFSSFPESILLTDSGTESPELTSSPTREFLGQWMASSSSRTRSSSPFSNNRPASPSSSTSSSHLSNRLLPRSSSTSGGGIGSRSMTPSRTFSDYGPIGSESFGTGSSVPYPSEELLGEPVEETISSERDSISVTVRFRPLRYILIDLIALHQI